MLPPFQAPRLLFATINATLLLAALQTAALRLVQGPSFAPAAAPAFAPALAPPGLDAAVPAALAPAVAAVPAAGAAGNTSCANQSSVAGAPPSGNFTADGQERTYHPIVPHGETLPPYPRVDSDNPVEQALGEVANVARNFEMPPTAPVEDVHIGVEDVAPPLPPGMLDRVYDIDCLEQLVKNPNFKCDSFKDTSEEDAESTGTEDVGYLKEQLRSLQAQNEALRATTGPAPCASPAALVPASPASAPPASAPPGAIALSAPAPGAIALSAPDGGLRKIAYVRHVKKHV